MHPVSNQCLRMGNHADDDLNVASTTFSTILTNVLLRATACLSALCASPENVDMKYEISVSDTRFYQGRPVNPANTHKFLI